MDNFNNIIKQKVEQFEVPFNDTHWVEMDARLNEIQSKKKKTLLIGSIAAIATFSLFLFLLTPSNTVNDLNTSKQTPTHKSSEDTKTNGEHSTISKKGTINNDIVIEENLTKTNPIKVINTAEKKAVLSLKIIAKESKSATPVIIIEKNKASSQEINPLDKASTTSNNLELKTLTIAPIVKKAGNPINTEPSAPTIPQNTRNNKIKSVSHKVYEDENVSKKSIKRKRRGILSFISFKKKLYKVPLARKKK